MKGKHLHIVSLNIPFPADYGGAIDIFYKLKALSALGVNIHLHCFEYGRSHAKELDQICEKVYYYKRDMHWKHLLSKTPFIIKSRSSKELLNNLSTIKVPILFEGLHSCYYLNHEELKHQNQFVRTHNIEADYYLSLAKAEKKILDKVYLYLEYFKIRLYEPKLQSAKGLLTISKNDFNYFKPLTNSFYIKAFHPETEVKSLEGTGEYAIYHGNLSVAENEDAALFLIQKVFKHLNFALVIVGKNPSNKLRKEALKHHHIRIVENPQNKVLNQLLQQAQVHVLPTFQSTGIKLKLLKTLFLGRHCFANDAMIDNTELEDTCTRVNSPKEWIDKLKEFEEIPFTNQDILERKQALEKFNCTVEAQKIISLIYPQD